MHIKDFDIDEFDPGYALPKQGKRKSRRRQLENRSCNIFLGQYARAFRHSSTQFRAGIHPKKMLDWRSLERRYYQLETAWAEAAQALWGEMSRLWALHCKKDQDAWINIGDDELVKYEGARRTYSRSSASYEAKFLLESKKSVDMSQQYMLIPFDDGGSKVRKLVDKEARMMWARGVYHAAFTRAIEDRIYAYARSLKQNSSSAYHEPFIVLVRNDDRIRIVSYEDNGIRWLTGDLLTTPSHKKSSDEACCAALDDKKRCQ